SYTIEKGQDRVKDKEENVQKMVPHVNAYECVYLLIPYHSSTIPFLYAITSFKCKACSYDPNIL
ncbi:MAG TPA: hypothetical protein VIM64_23860, partial [Puia sp.]